MESLRGDALLLVLALHVVASASMAGLCWCVQLVHYPLLAHTRQPQDAAREHARRITLFVAPTMLAEAATALLLLASFPRDGRLWVGAGSLLGLWLLTFLKLVPLHARLQATGEASWVRALVRWNWPRTLLWTLRAGLAGWVCVSLRGASGQL